MWISSFLLQHRWQRLSAPSLFRGGLSTFSVPQVPAIIPLSLDLEQKRSDGKEGERRAAHLRFSRRRPGNWLDTAVPILLREDDPISHIIIHGAFPPLNVGAAGSRAPPPLVPPALVGEVSNLGLLPYPRHEEERERYDFAWRRSKSRELLEAFRLQTPI